MGANWATSICFRCTHSELPDTMVDTYHLHTRAYEPGHRDVAMTKRYVQSASRNSACGHAARTPCPERVV